MDEAQLARLEHVLPEIQILANWRAGLGFPSATGQFHDLPCTLARVLLAGMLEMNARKAT